MLHHIIKDFGTICPYCKKDIKEKENVHYFKHNYESLQCECGKEILKKTKEGRMSKFIKSSKKG
jgi:hypothetical protein